jgi:hypothetical protein
MSEHEDLDIIVDDEIVVPKLSRPTKGPNLFEVSLNTYPMQPWTSRSQLSQWFNYGFNPTTFTRYSIQQTKLFAESKLKHFDPK